MALFSNVAHAKVFFIDMLNKTFTIVLKQRVKQFVAGLHLEMCFTLSYTVVMSQVHKDVLATFFK